MNIAKFLRTTILKNFCERLLLNIQTEYWKIKNDHGLSCKFFTTGFFFNQLHFLLQPPVTYVHMNFQHESCLAVAYSIYFSFWLLLQSFDGFFLLLFYDICHLVGYHKPKDNLSLSICLAIAYFFASFEPHPLSTELLIQKTCTPIKCLFP